MIRFAPAARVFLTILVSALTMISTACTSETEGETTPPRAEIQESGDR